MPESIDRPRTYPPRRRRPFLIILAVLAGIALGGRTALFVLRGRALVRVARLRGRVLEDTEPSVGNLHGF